MDTRDAQEMMRRLYLDRDRARGVERTLLRTFQELSELSEAVASNAPSVDIAAEMADVFAWVCSLANLLGIDLSVALLAKYNNACSKCGQSPCRCEDGR